MENETHLVSVGEWVLRMRAPQGVGPHPVMYLLHGLTGDENVMWVFANRLPDHYLVIAPRGLHPAYGSGYSWYVDQSLGLPLVDDLVPAIHKLEDLPNQLQAEADSAENQDVWQAVRAADFSQLSLVGFSQGAALSYSYAMMNPQQVGLIAGLAGFLPDGIEDLVEARPLSGKPVFVTHGTEDNIVPIARARQSVELLERAGADVTYCEENVGHKLSASCFRAMGSFFSSFAYANGKFARRD